MADTRIHLPGGLKVSLASNIEDPNGRAAASVAALEEFAAIAEDYREKHGLPRRAMALILSTCVQLQIANDLGESPEGEGDEGGGIEDPASEPDSVDG